MKETINVNIGSVAFTLDEDAYALLKGYLDDIRERLSDDRDEIMADIESRIAEIFRERVTSPMRVITVEVVRATMAQIGTPSTFGARPDEPQPEPQEPPVKKIRRPCDNRSIAGVCAGLAEFLGIDTTLLRLITLFLILFGGLSLWVYIILWIVIPEESLEEAARKRYNKKR